MKDFKTMPKMACGGGVKKYNEGGDIVAEARKAVRAGKDLDPGIMAKSKPRTMNIDGKDVEMKSIEMPNLNRGEGVNVPGYGRVKPAPMQTRGNLQLLKKGGKAKRGNKK
jgi:hypothetical protein